MPQAAKSTTKKTVSTKPAKSGGPVVPMIDKTGKEAGTYPVPKEMFAAEPNTKLLAQYVRMYLANQRQGTASTKTRGEIVGSTRKIYKQKGTGNARHGDIKAPIFVGGGVVGGPKPRKYYLDMNKKQRKMVLFSALTVKLKEKNIFGLEKSFTTIEPKTKNMASFLKSAHIHNKKILLVTSNTGKNNVMLASRNLPNVTLEEVTAINAYILIKNHTILFTEDALTQLVKHYLKNES